MDYLEKAKEAIQRSEVYSGESTTRFKLHQEALAYAAIADYKAEVYEALAYAAIAQAEQLKRLADNQDRQLDLVLSSAARGLENNKTALEAIVAQAEQLRRIADALENTPHEKKRRLSILD